MTSFTEKIPVIFDCDNTFGVPGCDVDDGLALLYLLGCPEVELLGVTCSFGNNQQSTVYRNTCRLLRAWGRNDIPVYRGADDPTDRQSAASEFLAEMAQKYAGKLYILATGAMTNLLGATLYDPNFFSNVAAFSLMGGLTEPLLVGGKPMAELNLSCDPAASLAVLRREGRVMIATAKNSLASFFPTAECKQIFWQKGGPLSRYLNEHMEYWFDLYAREWNLQGIVVWDVMAAVQMLHPEFVEMVKMPLTPTLKSLETGWLIGDGTPLQVWVPRIKDKEAYMRHVYDTFYAADVHIAER